MYTLVNIISKIKKQEKKTDKKCKYKKQRISMKFKKIYRTIKLISFKKISSEDYLDK